MIIALVMHFSFSLDAKQKKIHFSIHNFTRKVEYLWPIFACIFIVSNPNPFLKKVVPSLTDKTFAKMCCTIQSGTTAISSESGSALGLFCQMFAREVEPQKSDWQKQSSCKTFLPILSVSFQKLFTAILFSPLVYLFIRHSTEFNFPQKFHLSCMLSISQQAKKRGEPFFTKLMHDLNFQATRWNVNVW